MCGLTIICMAHLNGYGAPALICHFNHSLEKEKPFESWLFRDAHSHHKKTRAHPALLLGIA
jgi:hypothetical protein